METDKEYQDRILLLLGRHTWEPKKWAAVQAKVMMASGRALDVVGEKFNLPRKE